MTNPDLVPASGAVVNGAHLFPVRVYYEDTDFSGVVYHASYLRFMERGRSEFLRLVDVRHQGLLASEEPLVWAVRRLAVDYLKPAHVDESLVVRTRALGLGGARMHLSQSVARGGIDLLKADVEVCVLTLAGKPRRVPPHIRTKLEPFIAAKGQTT